MCANEYKLFSVGIVYFPEFKADIIEDFSLVYNININCICLSAIKPNILAENIMEFSDENKDCLFLTIGKYDDDGLVESSLGGFTESKELLKIWRKIAAKLKSFTHMGAWVVNPMNNAKSYYKNHYYTEAAKKVADEGTKIKPIAGWNYYILGS